MFLQGYFGSAAAYWEQDPAHEFLSCQGNPGKAMVLFVSGLLYLTSQQNAFKLYCHL